MKTNKYILADLLQFVIQRLVDEDPPRNHIIQLLLQAKNALLAPDYSSQSDQNFETIISEFMDPDKNPLMKDLADKLNAYEKMITDSNNFAKAFHQASDEVEKEDILQGLQKQPTL